MSSYSMRRRSLRKKIPHRNRSNEISTGKNGHKMAIFWPKKKIDSKKKEISGILEIVHPPKTSKNMVFDFWTFDPVRPPDQLLARPWGKRRSLMGKHESSLNNCEKLHSHWSCHAFWWFTFLLQEMKRPCQITLRTPEAWVLSFLTFSGQTSIFSKYFENELRSKKT